MSSYISEHLRRQVFERAFLLCEYCLFHEDDSLNTFHIEHIIPIKHSGKTILSNLAYSCPFCNLHKGTNIGTYLTEDLNFTPLFHPRNDIWSEHFKLSDVLIMLRTPVGEATIHLLLMNDEKRLIERTLLKEIGRYPGIGFEAIID